MSVFNGIDLEKGVDGPAFVLQAAFENFAKYVPPVLTIEEIVDDEDVAPEDQTTTKYLVCPRCGLKFSNLEDNIVVVDSSYRWNYADEGEVDDIDEDEIVHINPGDGEYEDELYYFHEACKKLVSLPERWDIDWS